MQLADDGLVLGVVAGEVAEDSGSTGDSGDIIGSQKNNQLPQQVIQMVLHTNRGKQTVFTRQNGRGEVVGMTMANNVQYALRIVMTQICRCILYTMC